MQAFSDKALMGKRNREFSMMKTTKEESDRALKNKFNELKKHKYWNHSYNNTSLSLSSSSFHLLNSSPRKLMSSLQTKRARSLSLPSSSYEDQEQDSSTSSVCGDCMVNDETEEVMSSQQVISSDDEEQVVSSDVDASSEPCSECMNKKDEINEEEEVKSVVESSSSVHSNTCDKNEIINADGVDKIYDEKNQLVEISKGLGEMTSTTNNVKSGEKIRVVRWGLCVFMMLLVGILVMLLVLHTNWYVVQDLDQVYLPPT